MDSQMGTVTGGIEEIKCPSVKGMVEAPSVLCLRMGWSHQVG